MTPVTLEGNHVRLEPLELHHLDSLTAASSGDSALYRWSPVPLTREACKAYIENALALRAADTALPFATIRKSDSAVVGSTRFWDLEHWKWPAGHARLNGPAYDVGEIGYTWLNHTAVRTAINTEAKYLMLRHGFEQWHMLRICLHTDSRNERSRNAIARIGGKFEGVLRAHRMAADMIPRDSARFSIVAEEWPNVKQRLQLLLRRA
jgi:RimJ/RimL family protein N-acetyltransferase